MLRDVLKWWLFPGINLHARQRYRILPQYFQAPHNGRPGVVLDAGCGNGMLSFQSYLLGNCVTGISIKEGEVSRNQRLFNDYLGIPRERLRFQVHNLYELGELGLEFNEIICSETLEHIDRDDDVCRSFFEALKPGGVLHLCCPNAEHPDNQAHHLDESESGGHVRAGYTWESYQSLLEPIGFEVSDPVGLGGSLRQACNKRITQAQHFGRLPLGLMTFLTLAPIAAFDGKTPSVPYSLYVRARKPTA
jgi:SAM-dependent methyltransferase